MPRIHAPASLLAALLVGLGCGPCDGPERVCAPLAPAAEAAPSVDDASLARLRERGPEGLAEILAAHDALPPGPEREALALAVDRVAGQRYASVSRLYWYTDAERARAAARVEGKPVLSLRLLGRLDEDLSCANSRLFRVALYADAEVSRYLREHFVLHWSSERPVPRATIDFGDGRVLATTVAGNSAHYVLDADARPIDVLPGLYGPAAFLAALEPARAFALELERTPEPERAAALAAYHAERLRAAGYDADAAWPDLGDDRSLAAAERTSRAKMTLEIGMVDRLALGPPLAAALEAVAAPPAAFPDAPPQRLDDASRRLIQRLRPSDWSPLAAPLDPDGLARLVTAFEEVLAVESARNEADFHRRIHTWFLPPGAPGARPSPPFLLPRPAPTTFAELNQRVYAELFRTPASDPWLGMATPGVVTGLPGDGLSVGAP